MTLTKNGLTVNVSPVMARVYLRQGWLPIDIKPMKNKTDEVTEETVEISQEDVDLESPTVYKKGDFTTKSKAEISELAETLGYTITATKKADMIDEFLAQQN